MSTFGLFIEPMSSSHGWTNSQIGGWVTSYFLGSSLASPFAGNIADRFGSRGIILLSIPVLAIAIGALGIGDQQPLWVLYFLGVTAGIASASIANGAGPSVRAVAAWFTKNRGIALGIVSAGASLATFMGPSCVQYVIGIYGWQSGSYFVAGGILLALPIVFLWLREPRLATERSTAAPEGLSRTDVIRRPLFWVFCAASFFCFGGIYGAMIFLVPFLTDEGLSPTAAATYMGLFGIASVAGKLIAGVLNDRFHSARVGAAAVLVQGLALIVLATVPLQDPLVPCLLLGLTYGTEGATVAYCMARYFGLRAFAELVGIISIVGAAGASIGPYGFGLLKDVTGTYACSFAVSAGVVLTGAFLFVLAARYPYPSDRARLDEDPMSTSKAQLRELGRHAPTEG